MPRLVYTPEGADPHSWDFSFGKIMFAERAAIERATGLGWDEVQAGFFNNRAEVIHAFLWVLLKREMPTLRPSEVDFSDDEIGLDLTDDEARSAAESLRAKVDLTEEEEEALAEIDARFAGEGDVDPKEG